MKIGVIGGGFVGSATRLLTSKDIECIVYDLNPEKCNPRNTTFKDVCNTEAVFIAVPTPITVTEEDSGKCNTRYVSSVIKQLKDVDYKGHIIVRSTVPVGYCDTQKVHFMPEFLTEKNWEEGNDIQLTQKQMIALIVELNDKTEEVIVKVPMMVTKHGNIFLN